MAKQLSLKQQLINQLAQQTVAQLQQPQQNNIQQLQAEYDAWNQQQQIASLQNEYDAWLKSQQTPEPAQQIAQPTAPIAQAVQEQPKVQKSIPTLETHRSIRNDQEEAKMLAKEAAQKQAISNAATNQTLNRLADMTQIGLGQAAEVPADKWLDPNYKLTNEDKEAARQYAQEELAKFNYNSSKKPILSSAEDRQHYADMVNLLNKSNGVTNALTGVIKQPLNLAKTVRDAGRSLGDQLGGLGAAITDKLGITQSATNKHNVKTTLRDQFYNQNDESMQRAYEGAKTQNPVATTAGEIGGQVGMYMLTNPLFDSLGAAAGLGKAGSFALNQVGQNLQDVALDTLPALNQMVKDGELSEEDKNALLQNIGLNAAGNLVMGGVGLGLGKLADNRAAKKAADAAFRANVSEGAEKLAQLVNPEDVDNVVRNATKQAEEAAANIENLAKQIPEVPEEAVTNPLEQAAKFTVEEAEDDIKLSDNEIKNLLSGMEPAEEAIETAAKTQQPKLQLPEETSAHMASDFDQLYRRINPDYKAVESLGNEKVDAAFNRFINSLNDYEKAAYNAENVDDVITAKRAVNSARKNLERQVKAVDPNLKLESTKYDYGKLVGQPEFRRTEIAPLDEATQDELIKTWNEFDESNTNKWLRGVGDEGQPPKNIANTEPIEPNKVMAEDIGLEQPKPEKVEIERIEEPVVEPEAPVPPKTAEEVPPEGGDYVSQFRTHNEENFNLTDEELNNKYFSTQNENFHFLKGDRASDLVNATKNLETDYDGTVNKLLTKPTDTQFTPQEVDEGFMAWNRELQAARETGDYGKSADIMYRMTRDAHDKGAGLQAYAAWKKSTPAGVVLDASEAARRMAVDEFGDGYVKELDNLTDKIDDICKGDGTLDKKLGQIEKVMKDAQAKGYKNGLTGFDQMKELLESGDRIDVSNIHDILYEANKVPNLSAKSQAEIASIASEMYGKQLTKAEKKQYINQINMILSKEKHWSVKDKAIEITHILMLSGTRTHLKNFVANVAMLPQEALARKISAVGQNAYRVLRDPNYKPTQAFHVGKEAKNLANAMYEQKGGADAIVEGIADKFTNRLADRIGPSYMFGVGKKNIAAKANDKALEAIPGLKKLEDAVADKAGKALKKIGSEGAYDAMDANVSLLENYRQAIYGSLSGLEDNPFVKKNFVDRLASYIQAQGIKSIEDIPEEAIDIARAEALKATFKDDNAITELVNSIKKIPVLGELEFPFTKTPANLLARSIDFSPIGLAKSLYGAINKNSRFAKETVGETIDEISKGIGGTATAALGMYLYANGLITGKKSDDPDIANYMANEGWQQYSLSSKGIADFINSRLGTDLDLGDDYYDFSFLQPSTTNIIAAQEVWDELMDGKKISEKSMEDIFNRVKSVAGSYTDALLAQSTFQNVSELFNSQYSDDGVGGNLIQNALEFPTRFTSGAISDAAKLTDDTRREYYSKNKPLETVKNAVASKLPVVSKSLPAKYDAFGNELTRNQSEGQKWANTLVNPSSASHRSKEPLYDYVDKLNDNSKGAEYVPTKTPRKFKLSDDTEFSLDNKQYSQLSKEAGDTRAKFLNDTKDNDIFKNYMDSTEKIAALDELEKVAMKSAYQSINKDAKVSQDDQELIDLYKEGGTDAVVKHYYGKKLVSDYDVSAGSNAAKEAKALVESGDIKGARKVLAKEQTYDNACKIAGIESKNETTRKAYENDGIKGLKEYKRTQDLYSSYDLDNNSTTQKVHEKYGTGGLKTLSELKQYGLGTTKAVDTYQNAKSSGVTVPSVKDFAGTYKIMDSYGNRDGEVQQKEFLSYVNANGLAEKEAQDLAKVYGTWSTIPVLEKGQWKFKRTK